MAEQQPPGPGKDKNETTPPSGATDPNPENSKKDGKDSKAPKPAGSNIERKPPRTPIKDRKWYKIATDKATGNIISALYTLATFVLLIATFFILKATRKSVKTSTDATTAAIKAANAADSTFGLAKSSFEIENTPYLEISDIKFEIHNGSVDTISYLLKSLGNFPIETFSDISYIRFYYKEKNKFFAALDSSIFQIMPIASTHYISKEAPNDLSIATGAMFSKEAIRGLRSGELALIMDGKTIYSNPANRKPRAYIYQIQLFPIINGNILLAKPRYFFTYNENFDLPVDTSLNVIIFKRVPLIPFNYVPIADSDEMNQNEFDKIRHPYLDISINSFDSVTTRKVQIAYSLINTTDTPIRILSRKIGYNTDTLLTESGIDIKAVFKSISRDKDFKKSVFDRNHPLDDTLKIHPIPPLKEYPKLAIDEILYLQYYIYITQEIEYENVNTGKKFIFRSIIITKPFLGVNRTPFAKTIYKRVIEDGNK